MRRLRTGISWADFHRPKGREWYDWQMRQLAEFLDPKRDAIEGFHVDENQYHMGLVTYGGREKPAYAVMRELVEVDAEEERAVEAWSAAPLPA